MRRVACSGAVPGSETVLVVEVADRRVEVHQHPGESGYHVVMLLDATCEVEVPGLGLRWSVAELLP